jgi:hypothetical protein
LAPVVANFASSRFEKLSLGVTVTIFKIFTPKLLALLTQSTASMGMQKMNRQIYFQENRPKQLSYQ